MGKLFGTDGVRGIANKELTASLAYDMGRATTVVLGERAKRPVFVIGRDTRLSGDMLENAITAGILSVGGNVIKLGVIPTPAVAYLVRHYEADAGIVISASHNSYEYNGIKIFNDEGFKLDDSIEERIEEIVLSEDYPYPENLDDNLGRCLEGDEDAVKVYTDFLLSTMDKRLDGIKVVLDAANGAAYQTAHMVYSALGADVTMLFAEPNGININNGCGSTHPQMLQAIVKEIGATVGFAFDGDADRLIVVDEQGDILDGDYVMCICGKDLKEQNHLFEDKLTTTIMSNIGLHKYLTSIGIATDVTPVGDRYVIESMRETGSVLGGEQSGHMIFREYSTTGDGVLSSLQFMKAYLSSGTTVSGLKQGIQIYPQALINARVQPEYKEKALEDADVIARIREVEEQIGNSGRLLIRQSGTEPLIRVMLEGEDAVQIKEFAKYIASLIVERYGQE